MNPKQQGNPITQEGASISQVSSASNLGKKISAVFLILVVTLMVFFTLFSSSRDKKSVDKSTITPDYQDNQNSGFGRFAALGKGGVNQPDINQLARMRAKMLAEKMLQNAKLYRMRQGAPIEMYTVSNSSGGMAGAGGGASWKGSNLPLSRSQINRLKQWVGSNDKNRHFQNQVSNTPVETVAATRIVHSDYTVPQGTLIDGTLQTAINSGLPGMVKAVVSRDVYAASGDRVLIPKGSTLIGQYNADVSMGQRRVFVVWSRVIRPDGIDVMLGSPGTNTLGQGGLGANVLDTHFLARFGQASLLSLIGAGISNAGVSGSDQYNSADAYRAAIANNFQSVASASLNSTMNIKPTIHVYQGTRINVFVAKDLSFYNALTKQA